MECTTVNAELKELTVQSLKLSQDNKKLKALLKDCQEALKSINERTITKEEVEEALKKLWVNYLYPLYYPDGVHRGNPPDHEDVTQKIDEWAEKELGTR